ncbi:MAG: flavodoxin [Firmicutes bacterium]|nr:flavodoxin [Bacillota bacterium]
MKTVVIYKSKTGFTQKYAEWIAEDLSADLFEVSKVNSSTLTKYDTIIYGGSLSATGIIGVKFLKKNIDKLMDKRVIVYACGASPPNEDVLNEVMTHNFTSDQQKHIKVFYVRGGFNYNKLPPFDKVLMTLFKWKIILKKSIKKKLNSDEIGMLEAYNKPVDFTERSNIEQIVTYINS